MAESNGGAPAVWSVEDYRRARAGVTELPSGMVVRLRAVSATDLALSGTLPDPLSQHVFRDVAELEAEAATPEERQRVRLEKAQAINAVACAIMAEPRVVPDPAGPGVPEPPEGALYVSELVWSDRLHLFNIACGTVEAGLARFPAEPAAGVSPAPAGAGVLEPAERDPRSATG